jgi:hypothetical protein
MSRKSRPIGLLFLILLVSCLSGFGGQNELLSPVYKISKNDPFLLFIGAIETYKSIFDELKKVPTSNQGQYEKDLRRLKIMASVIQSRKNDLLKWHENGTLPSGAKNIIGSSIGVIQNSTFVNSEQKVFSNINNATIGQLRDIYVLYTPVVPSDQQIEAYKRSW